jgi:hypothetical protein
MPCKCTLSELFGPEAIPSLIEQLPHGTLPTSRVYSGSVHGLGFCKTKESNRIQAVASKCLKGSTKHIPYDPRPDLQLYLYLAYLTVVLPKGMAAQNQLSPSSRHRHPGRQYRRSVLFSTTTNQPRAETLFSLYFSRARFPYRFFITEFVQEPTRRDVPLQLETQSSISKAWKILSFVRINSSAVACCLHVARIDKDLRSSNNLLMDSNLLYQYHALLS